MAILLSICLFLGSMMTCAGYMAGHALDKAPASRFLTKDTAAVLTASMPDTVYFMGIRLQKRTVQTLLLNTRIQKYLDDLISGLHTYMRTGTEPRLNYSAIATRLVRLIEQEQLPANVEYQLTEHGGHVGFVGGTLRKPEMWLEKRIPDWLTRWLGAQI